MMNKKELNPAITAPNWLRRLFSFLEFVSPILTSRIATLFFFTPIRFSIPKIEFEISNKSISKTIKDLSYWSSKRLKELIFPLFNPDDSFTLIGEPKK